MRVYLLRSGQKEEGPMSIEDVRDRLDLRMIPPEQPCRIAGLDGTYVAGELVTGHLFKGWEPEEEEETDDSPEIETPDISELEEEPEETGEDDGEEEAQDDELEGEEDEEDYEEEPWWEGKPGYTAFLTRVVFTLLAAIASVVSFLLAWPGWVSVVLAALSCLSLAFLLGRRSATHYAMFERRLQWREEGFLRRVHELPRSAVDAIDIRRPFPGWLLGRADIHFHHSHPNLPNPVVFRQVARAGEARSLWR